MAELALPSAWCERVELRLEGGGHLPGASQVVDIRHKVISCTAHRKGHRVLVRGQLQVHVYYRFAGSSKVLGQGAEVPWRTELAIPSHISGQPEARVIDVRHEYTYDPATEDLQHAMTVVFEVSVGSKAAEAQPADRAADEPPVEEPEQPVAIPAWAREAAEELMRAQVPEASASPPDWLRAQPQPGRGPVLGAAQGLSVRAGQAYEGPEPVWPRGMSFALVEKALEGEPYAGATTAQDQPLVKEETAMAEEPAASDQKQLPDEGQTPATPAGAQAAESSEGQELVPVGNSTVAAGEPAPAKEPAPAESEPAKAATPPPPLVWKPFPKSDL